ncbi:unnamed protein product [Moneuplotes crassus]|uniref:Uncharacterized protein n=1 Tax=Euplotes crassus TaxID=5936 RepID=A0AAD2D0I7_EUPCR|nr:unnamed protein product [Moneuplotes crassus]
MNAKRPQEVQNTNKLKNKDASKIKEFVAHLEQRSKLQDKIQKLRMKKQRITKLMNYASQESIPSSSSQLNMSSESGDIDLKDKVMSQENVSGIPLGSECAYTFSLQANPASLPPSAQAQNDQICSKIKDVLNQIDNKLLQE